MTSEVRVTSRERGPMGHVLWHTTRGDYLWNGRGSGLLMVLGSGMNATITTIDNPVANGKYDTERDARAALDRFLALFANGAEL